MSSFYVLYLNSHWNVWGRVKQITKETTKEIRFIWLEKNNEILYSVGPER